MKHSIPYGINSFREIRLENNYYIDKTMFLKELENYKAPVFLRPRRFGKSLFCSMISSYYDINQADDFEKLFGDLSVGKNPTPLKHKFMILHLDFSRITPTTDLNELKQNFSLYIYQMLNQFLRKYKSFFAENTTLDPNLNASALLNIICTSIVDPNGPSIYIIIDEYDSFSNYFITTNNDALYEEITVKGDFFKGFFKTIKSAITDKTVGKVFITGVLPITLDDITSSFNIRELITLKKQFHAMAGFTQEEITTYVDTIFTEYTISQDLKDTILSLLKGYYNGYCFIPSTSDRLYNSTIVTYFLKSFVLDGEIPRETMDPNLKTDVSWIERLAQGKASGLEKLNTILDDNRTGYSLSMLTSSFNKDTFFNKDFFSIALFYLGFLSIEDDFDLIVPNQSVKLLLTGYYNDLSDIVKDDNHYIDVFKRFSKDLDLPKMFDGYWQTYISQINAQAFDKINENFFRITFFELCSRYLTASFTFGIEVTYPSGRSDWEMLGKPHTMYKNKKWVVEFKYFNKADAKAKKILKRKEPLSSDVEQVNKYALDILAQFPEYSIKKYVIYIVSNDDFNCFEVQ